jgi:membrane protein DedA with SNARE-associated domain
MSDFLLTQTINYGAPVFGLILFLAAAGAPLPATFLLIAVGAFSQQGVLDWKSMTIVGWLCAVAGDTVSFGMGFYAKSWVSKRMDGSPAWKSAQRSFDARAGLAIYLTRFFVTALATPTNLIAGGSGIQFRRFVVYDALGELTWVSLYGGLGYLFSSQWELVSEFISSFGGLALGLVLMAAGIWFWAKRLKNLQNAKDPVSEI